MVTENNIKVRQSADEYEILVAQLARPWDDMFLYRLKTELSPDGKSGSILDVGLGTGLIVREMAQSPEFAGFHFVGIDYYPDMVEKSKAKVAEEGLSDRITVEEGDASKLQYPDNSFDVVMSRATIHHLADPTDALKEKYRVLKPGGFCLIHDIRRDAPQATLDYFTNVRAKLGIPPTVIEEKFTMPEMRSFIERAGLKDVAVLVSAESGPESLGFELFFRKPR